jgi:hypothetical protein
MTNIEIRPDPLGVQGGAALSRGTPGDAAHAKGNPIDASIIGAIRARQAHREADAQDDELPEQDRPSAQPAASEDVELSLPC